MELIWLQEAEGRSWNGGDGGKGEGGHSSVEMKIWGLYLDSD